MEITWREEGESSGAYLGEELVGEVWHRAEPKTHPDQRNVIEHWGWMFDITQLGGEAPTLSAAKAALAEAVGGWVARAGLVKDEGWQDISSAPKDGTPILVWPSLWQRPCDEAWWNDDRYANVPRPYWERPSPASKTQCRHSSPTRWHALPTPPARS